jgi:hypothetical protein
MELAAVVVSMILSLGLGLAGARATLWAVLAVMTPSTPPPQSYHGSSYS